MSHKENWEHFTHEIKPCNSCFLILNTKYIQFSFFFFFYSALISGIGEPVTNEVKKEE